MVRSAIVPDPVSSVSCGRCAITPCGQSGSLSRSWVMRARKFETLAVVALERQPRLGGQDTDVLRVGQIQFLEDRFREKRWIRFLAAEHRLEVQAPRDRIRRERLSEAVGPEMTWRPGANSSRPMKSPRSDFP